MFVEGGGGVGVAAAELPFADGAAERPRDEAAHALAQRRGVRSGTEVAVRGISEDRGRGERADIGGEQAIRLGGFTEAREVGVAGPRAFKVAEGGRRLFEDIA